MDNIRKIIFHVDVNSAFLSWSAVKILKDDPTAIDLRTIPSAVGGDVESRHGIITAKSIPAKKYGVTTGEPVVKALQKCPNLVMVHSDFKIYRDYSRKFIRILKTYSQIIEQVSIDEAFIDMTEPVNDMYRSAGDIECTKEEALKEFALIMAGRIKDEIRNTLGFTVNVGVSSNKLLAKMASDFEKPDKIHTLFPEEVRSKMWPLPIGELYGCGKQTSARLSELGMRTIGDVANTDPKLLQDVLGIKQGGYIYQSCNGYGSSDVNPYEEEAKSYSNETTTRFDISFSNYESEMPQILKWLSESVSRRLQRDGAFASTISVSVKTDAFQRRSKQVGIGDSTNDEEIILKTSKRLMDELVLGENGLFAKGYSIRLVGVGASDLDKGEYRQMSLFDLGTQSSNSKGNQNAVINDAQRAEKQRRLREMTKSIEDKYGEGIIHKGR